MRIGVEGHPTLFGKGIPYPLKIVLGVAAKHVGRSSERSLAAVKGVKTCQRGPDRAQTFDTLGMPRRGDMTVAVFVCVE